MDSLTDKYNNYISLAQVLSRDVLLHTPTKSFDFLFCLVFNLITVTLLGFMGPIVHKILK